MKTGSIGRRLAQILGVIVLAGAVVGCAGPHNGPTVAPAGYGNDELSRADRLMSYCDRLAAKGELVTALGLCARAHEINPDDSETLMKIASILRGMDRKQAAMQAYITLLDRDPSHYEARYNLGKIYMETGDTAMAAVQFTYAMTKNPEDPRPYNALGILRDQAGEHTAAQALYRLALVQDPKNLSVRNNLGLSLALDGQRDEAIEILAELAMDPRVEPMMLRNLEAASAASRPAPTPASLTVPAAPGAMDLPAASKSEPAKAEVRETPPAAAMPRRVPAGPSEPTSSMPAQSAPTPLFVVPAPGEEDARQSGAGSDGAAPGSVILAAAEKLMEPPAWADFEPGTLISSDPVAAAPLTKRPAAPEEDLGDVSAEPLAVGAVIKLGEFDLSLLMQAGSVYSS